MATLINIINVFNSLPILRMITGSLPGYDADTTTTLIFKLIQSDRQIDTASALSVVNFALVVVIIAIYLRIVEPMQEDRSDGHRSGAGRAEGTPREVPVGADADPTPAAAASAVLMAAAGAVVALVFLAAVPDDGHRLVQAARRDPAGARRRTCRSEWPRRTT